MLMLNNMNLKEKNLKKNSNQLWLKYIKNKVDKECQIWEAWVDKDLTCQTKVVTKVEDRALKLMKLID